jgi:hypothetical protein
MAIANGCHPLGLDLIADERIFPLWRITSRLACAVRGEFRDL